MPGELENISKKMRELVDGMKSSFQKASANISGHIGEVMSDEIKMTTETIKSVGASAKESSMKILKFFGTGWTLELKSFAVDKKQLDVLEDIKNQGKEEKLSRLTRFKKTKGAKFLAALLDFLGIPLAILAAGIGALVGQILIPFKAIWKVAKVMFAPLFKLFDWLSKGKIGGLFRAVKKSKFFLWLGRLFSFFAKLPGLRVILAGLKVGFTKLLWPLQILLSLIDFVKGYMETEGSIMDKIKGGFKNMIMKFIEWPVHVIGKFIDWLFGMEAGTSETAMIKGVETYLDLFFKYFNFIFGPIKDALGWLVEFLQTTTWKDVTDTIDNIKKWCIDLPGVIIDYLKDIWNKAVEFVLPEFLAEKLRFKGTHLEEAQRAAKLADRAYELEVKKYHEQIEMNKNMKAFGEKYGRDVSSFITPPKEPKLGLPIPASSEDGAINSLVFQGGGRSTGGSGGEY